MKIRNTIFLLAAAGFFYIFSIIGSSCAQIGMPTGGPRDTLPPVLLKSTPPNGSTHFNEKKIVLSFDEYVHLDNLQNNLLVAPTPKLPPGIDYKLKTVTIKLRDTLQENTTYSIELGNAIQDLNENNPLRNFTYVFSTGAYIDSLQFDGSVQLAETGKVDTTILVLLYKNLSDSAIYKEKPRYIARLNSKGEFKFHHLASGTYHVFALKDESGQKIYNNPTQIFAFSDSAVIVSKDTHPQKLYAYAQEKPFVKPPAEGRSPADKKLKYTVSFSGNIQDIISPIKLDFNHKLKNFDSLKIRLTDTLFNPIRSAVVTIDTAHKEVTVKNNWTENTIYKLLVEKDFAKDTAGNELAKSDTIKFKTKKENEYGSIKINFKNLAKFKHPVLQFVVNNEVVNSFALTSPTWSVPLFKPGEYELRILDDTNQNGIWDPGNYHLKRQPEKVYSITQPLNIRADWGNERDIEL